MAVLKTVLTAKPTTGTQKHTVQEYNKVIATIDNNADEILQMQIEAASRKEVVITGGGNTTSGADSNQFEDKFNIASEQNRNLLLPSPDANKMYQINRTINVRPPSGKSEFYTNVIGSGIPRGQIYYDGPEGTPCLSIAGLRFATWDSIKIALANKVGLICFDLDTLGVIGTNPSIDSTSHVRFNNCQGATGSMANQNQKIWRMGFESKGGADISNIKFDTCFVAGKYGGAVNPLDYGWQIYGPNTLANVWDNCFGARMGKMFSNKAEDGIANKTGNGACYFFGTSTSQNLLDFEIANSQSYLISGGRFESGKQVLSITGGNISPAVTFQNVNIDDYEGVTSYGANSNRNLFFMDMPASLSLDNCNIKSGQWPSYDQNMIRGFGPGGQGLFGSVLVRGGGIQAGVSGFASFGSDPTWVLKTDTVKRLNSTGMPIGMFANS